MRIFEATGADIADLGEEHGHRVQRVIPSSPPCSTPVWTCATSRSPPATPVRTTMRYDRARKNLDRHRNYILAAYLASGT